MEVVFALPLLIIPFILPLIAGLMAKTYGRNFWTWFLVGMLLPFIAQVILLCLPDKSVNKGSVLKAIPKNEKAGDTAISKTEETDMAATA